MGFLITVAVIAVIVLPIIFVGAVGSSLNSDKNLRARLPEIFDELFDGTDLVTYNVPIAVQVGEVIEAGRERGYVFRQSVDGPTGTPTLLFDKDPAAWAAKRAQAGPPPWTGKGPGPTPKGPAKPRAKGLKGMEQRMLEAEREWAKANPRLARGLKIGLVSLLCLGGVVSCVSWANSGSGGGNSSTSRVLRESTAEVACERVVRENLGVRLRFKQGANWEIDGGWAINGRATGEGVNFGYSCEVTGPEGAHRVEIVSLG